MMEKILVGVGFAILLVLVIFAFFGVTNAANPFDISYPIVELGSCASQQECKVFCDDSVNAKTCFDWAADNGFVSEKEVKRTRDMERMNEGAYENNESKPIDDFGPGDCGTPEKCDAFCRQEENLNICLDYSVKRGYMDASEAEKIKAKAAKGGPGGCKSRESCDAFCRNPQNMKECMQFSVDEGKITQEEADFMAEQAKITQERGQGSNKKGPKGPAEPKIDEKKAEEILQQAGGGPGGCKNPEECRNYCSTSERMEECMKFAEKYNLMPKEEMEKAKKMMTLGGPGGCKNQQECDAFCGQPGNGEKCMQFAIDNGLMAPEEIEMMKKQMEIVKKLDQRGGPGGPGGCRDQRECSDFCGKPENLESCMNFSTQNGMIKKDQAQMMMQEGKKIENRMQMMEGNFTPPKNFQSPDGKESLGPTNEQQRMMRPPEGMGFPGQSVEGQQMPYRPEMMPQQQFQQSPEGFQPPTNFQPPTDFRPPTDFQYQPQMQQPGMMSPPPSGTMMQPPPTGNFPPPPADGNFMSPPPTTETRPSSFAQPQSIIGTILTPFLEIFR